MKRGTINILQVPSDMYTLSRHKNHSTIIGSDYKVQKVKTTSASRQLSEPQFSFFYFPCVLPVSGNINVGLRIVTKCAHFTG